MVPHDSYVADNFHEVQAALKDCDLDAIAYGTNQSNPALSQAFFEAARKAKPGCGEPRFRALNLVGTAYSFIPSLDKPNAPSGPAVSKRAQRSAIPDDFTEAEIKVLAGAVEHVNNPILKARLADVVWACQKPRAITYALTAIDNYTKTSLEVDNWFRDGHKRWHRAIILARMIGKEAGDRLDRIADKIVQALQSATSDDQFFACSLADTLKSNGLGKTHSATVAAKLESLAHELNAIGNFHLSSIFYNAASDWFKWSGNVDKSVDMTVAEAEAFVGDANARLSSEGSNYTVAASFQERAVQVYRSICHDHRPRHQVDQRIQNIRLLINDYGKRASTELTAINGPEIDPTELVKRARYQVSGKPLPDALKAFANLHQTSAAELRNGAIDSLSDLPLRAITPKVFSSHGRVVAKTPGISSSKPSEDDEAEINAEDNKAQIDAEMISLDFRLLVDAVVTGYIMPALDTLNLEHHLQTVDFVELARRSPVVPPGRETLFGKALSFGFNYDFGVSVHLLAPQIEHMVRTHLNAAGVNTTNLDSSHGIETQNSLNSLINKPEASTIFGDDLAFEIRALFCDQFGPNLRNNVAHGLLDDHHSSSPGVIYAWWLAFKMVFNTYWNSPSVDAEEETLTDAH